MATQQMDEFEVALAVVRFTAETEGRLRKEWFEGAEQGSLLCEAMRAIEKLKLKIHVWKTHAIENGADEIEIKAQIDRLWKKIRPKFKRRSDQNSSAR